MILWSLVLVLFLIVLLPTLPQLHPAIEAALLTVYARKATRRVHTRDTTALAEAEAEAEAAIAAALADELEAARRPQVRVMNFCHHCGAKLMSPQSVYCNSCGKPLAEVAQS